MRTPIFSTMGDDELDNLTERITGDKSESDEEMDERLEEASILTSEGEVREPPEKVIGALGDDDPERSADAADALERLAKKNPSSLEGHEDSLIEALKIDDSWARRASAAALAEVGSEEAAEKLEQLDIPEAQEAADEIHERIGSDESEKEEKKEETEQKEESMDEESTETEGQARAQTQTDEGQTEEAATATSATSTTDGGTKAESSAASTGEGRALDVAKEEDVGVDLTEIVVLQMLESDKEEPNKYAEESLRHAIREYPEMAMDMTDSLAERLTEGRDDVRRYASIVMHEISKEHVEEAREYIPEIVESLGDDDDEVSERGQESLTNIAEEYPDDVVGNVAQMSKND